MSNITTVRNQLVARLQAAGLDARAGFMGQHVDTVTANGLICIQPTSEPAVKQDAKSISTSRLHAMVLAVPAGPDQDAAMDTLLLAMRKALFFNNRLRSLEGTTGNHFIMDQGVTFFIPEGHEFLFCAEQPITLRYQDEL